MQLKLKNLAASIIVIISLFGSALPAFAIGEHTSLFFRLFNPRTGDHFYTSNAAERSAALSSGYKDEGVLGAILTSSTASSTALFRLFNSRTGDHFYTTSATERATAISSGYVSEDTAGFIFPTLIAQTPSLLPMFRLFNPHTGDHFYTTSITERIRATQRSGYTFEGITGYIPDPLFNEVRVQNVSNNQKITSPLTVTGEARGTWFFEGSFPIRIFSQTGQELASGTAQAQSNAMTSDFVPFTSTPLNFTVPDGVTQGFLFLEKDNPSGLPQSDNQLVIPVQF